MKNRIFNFLEKIRTSLWFTPTIMIFLAVVLAEASVKLDEMLVESAEKNFPIWLFSGGPEAARTILSVLAGSMATVVSLVISMTMLTFTIASSQYGPRLLRNFIADQGNQFMLGMFMASFIFSVSVLRSVRSEEKATVFVPEVSITIAIFLTVFSFILLIYLLHHVAVSLRVETLVANVGDELNGMIDRIYPYELESGENRGIRAEVDEDALEKVKQQPSHALLSKECGYIQSIDYDALAREASEQGFVLRLYFRPGHFVLKNELLGDIFSKQPDKIFEEDNIRKLLRAFSIGKNRTPAQDIEFSIDQLVEVALVALSPGVNKTFTAIACIDRLGEALAHLARRELPSPYHFRDDRLWLVSYPVDFQNILAAAFSKIRQNARTNPAVTIHLLKTIRKIAGQARSAEAIEALEKQSDILREDNLNNGFSQSDQQNLENAYRLAKESITRSEKYSGDGQLTVV